MQFLKRSRIAVFAAAAAAAAMLITPLLSSAEPPIPPSAAAPQLSDAQTLQIEFLTLRQALASAEEAALGDPAMQKLHDELQTAIQAAMRAEDASHDAKMARLTELGQTLQNAQLTEAEPDMEKLEPLMVEAQGLQEQLVAVQMKVVESEPLASRIGEMRTQMLAKMTEVDPKVPEHMKRIEELASQLY